MQRKIRRRDFIKFCAAGSCWTLILGGGNLLGGDATGAGRVAFRTRIGTGGCSQCETAIKLMLMGERSDELEKLFAGREEVVFYVRRHADDTKPDINSIAVGDCTASLASHSIMHIKGCRDKIKPTYIFKKIRSDDASKSRG